MSFSYMRYTCYILSNAEIYLFLLQKNVTSPDIKFLLHTVGEIERVNKIYLKKCTSTANEFLFLDVETIRKYLKKLKNSHLENFISPAIELLLHSIRSNRKLKIKNK